jgi:hypothetical protein
MQIAGEGEGLLYLNLSHLKEQMQLLAEAIATCDGREVIRQECRPC